MTCQTRIQQLHKAESHEFTWERTFLDPISNTTCIVRSESIDVTVDFTFSPLNLITEIELRATGGSALGNNTVAFYKDAP